MRGVEVIAEERRVDGHDLHVHALRVHVLQPLFGREAHLGRVELRALAVAQHGAEAVAGLVTEAVPFPPCVDRSEEHTSELQSLTNLVCRLLLEKKKNKQT